MKVIVRVLVCFSMVYCHSGCNTQALRDSEMDVNARVFHSSASDLVIGKKFNPFASSVKVARSMVLGWNSDITVNELFRQWKRPTYMQLSVTYDSRETPSLMTMRSVPLRLLPSGSQIKLREDWRSRILEAFQGSTFHCDPAALSRSLDGKGVTIHYCLVARHDNAQMGHVDVVKFIGVDENGCIVVMTRPEYSLDYPYGFVDEKKWKYDFLF